MNSDNPGKPRNTPDSSPPTGRSHARGRADDTTLVRLIRKYADMIDGVNLEQISVGDRLELPRRDADVLIAEGWAVYADERRMRRRLPVKAQAANSPRLPSKKR